MGSEPAEVTAEYRSARRFQMWRYEVGHSQLLLRSVKREGATTRVDILFKNVREVSLPTSMDGLSIVRTAERFALAGSAWNGHVDAGVCFVAEDDGEFFDPSSFTSSLRQDP